MRLASFFSFIDKGENSDAIWFPSPVGVTLPDLKLLRTEIGRLPASPRTRQELDDRDREPVDSEERSIISSSLD